MQVRTVNGRTKWPLGRMKVGESVVVRDKGKWRTARVIASYYSRGKRKYKANVVEKGLRIKRVS